MRNVFLIGICACGLGAAADAPYAGSWKMNVAKSDFGDTTVTYEQMSGGEMKATMDGQSYTFKTDGDYTIVLYLAGTGISPTIPTDEEARLRKRELRVTAR